MSVQELSSTLYIVCNFSMYALKSQGYTRIEQTVGSSPFSSNARRPFYRLFVPLKLKSKSWEPCPFNKVPAFSQT
jgi:hypothetical protein